MIDYLNFFFCNYFWFCLLFHTASSFICFLLFIPRSFCSSLLFSIVIINFFYILYFFYIFSLFPYSVHHYYYYGRKCIVPIKNGRIILCMGWYFYPGSVCCICTLCLTLSFTIQAVEHQCSDYDSFHIGCSSQCRIHLVILYI